MPRDWIKSSLRDSEHLRVAATTRETVGGLEPGEAELRLDRIDDDSAVRLLADRALDSDRVWAEISRERASGRIKYSDALTGLLNEFQGYPLAINIAAHHLRNDLSVGELLKKIRAEGLAVFDDPNIRDQTERTRMTSLAMSLRLSITRLKEDGFESALSLFGLLSMFPSGLTKQMLARLALPGWEANLPRLRDYSIVEYDEEDSRYYLLAPVRGFARGYTDEALREKVIAQSAPLFAALAAGFYSNWSKLGAGETARLLARDEANLLAMINLARGIGAPSPQEAGPSLAIAGNLMLLYQAIDRLGSSVELSETILAEADWENDPAGSALIRRASGDLALRRDQLETAEEHYAEAEKLYRQIGASLGVANTLQARGDLARRRSQLEAAEGHYAEAEKLYRQVGESVGLANTLQARGDLALRRSQLEAAEGHYAEAEKLYRQVGESVGLANTLQWMGDLAKVREDYPEALSRYEKSRLIYERIEDKLGLSNVLVEIGELDVIAGRKDEAITHVGQALRIGQQCQNGYAIQKSVDLLKELGIDPETLLK
jgi:tetratricopeptide (TPR) repeat protein